MKSALLKLATIFVTLVLCLAIGEIALRVFTLFPVSEESNTIGHPDLGFVMDPSLTEIDEYGFRNPPNALEGAEIAFIGDSHTYGYLASSEDAFPSFVARKTGRKTYNFGIGGYGVYQYKVLLDRMAESDFKTVVLGLYPRNDLYTTCKETQTEYWRKYAVENNITMPACRGKPYPTGLRLYARSLSDLLKNSATRDAIRTLVWDRIKEKWFPDKGISQEEHFLFPGGYAVPRYYFDNLPRVVALDDPTVATTFENSKIFLRQAKAQLDRRGIRFLVLMIPSKSQVLHGWAMQQNIPLEADFVEGIAVQDSLDREFKAFFEAAGIRYKEALPYVAVAFARSMENGTPFYPPTDGHPYAIGYEAYAEAVVAGLAEMGEH